MHNNAYGLAHGGRPTKHASKPNTARRTSLPTQPSFHADEALPRAGIPDLYATLISRTQGVLEATERGAVQCGSYLHDTLVLKHLGADFVFPHDQTLSCDHQHAVLEPLHCGLWLGLTTDLQGRTRHCHTTHQQDTDGTVYTKSQGMARGQTRGRTFMVIIVPVSLGMIEGLSRKVGANPSGTILPSAKCERRESDTFPLGARPGCYT